MEDEIIGSISRVLEGELTTNSLPVVPLCLLFDTCKQYGCELDHDDYRSNGWQVDFWQDLSYKGNEYTISGSLFDGDYKIYKK